MPIPLQSMWVSSALVPKQTQSPEVNTFSPRIDHNIPCLVLINRPERQTPILEQGSRPNPLAWQQSICPVPPLTTTPIRHCRRFGYIPLVPRPLFVKINNLWALDEFHITSFKVLYHLRDIDCFQRLLYCCRRRTNGRGLAIGDEIR